MRSILACWIILAPLAVAAPAAADGMAFPQVTGSTVEVQATAQRAALWRRGSTWELHLQPEFDGEAGALAWVVPFPVRPTVSEGNPEFLDQLEQLTAPAFVETCDPPYCYLGEVGAADAAGGEGPEIRGSETSVTVWESGTVAGLDYVILSAGDGDSLVAWMDENNYRLPEAATDLLANLETEGLFFFVSRLPAGASPNKVIRPIRFELPGMDPPVYPLRLTALGIPPGTFLDLTLWVIFTPDHMGAGFLPASHPFGTLDESLYVPDAEHYRAEVDAFFAAGPPDRLLLLFAQQVYDATARTVCDWAFITYYYDNCRDIPSEVTPGAELREIAAARAMVQRYQARLTAAASAADLVFRTATAAEMPSPDNAYVHSVGLCYSCPGNPWDAGGHDAAGGDAAGASASGGGIACALTPHRLGTPASLGVVVLGTGIVLRRLRSRRSTR